MPDQERHARRVPTRRARESTALLLALLAALLVLASVVGDGPPDELVDLAALGTMCATCWSAAPLDLQQFAARFALTSRELQVARCASNGSSNREIAEHLGLSTRTIEGHLLRTSEKVGIRKRVRLALLVQSITPPDR